MDRWSPLHLIPSERGADGGRDAGGVGLELRRDVVRTASSISAVVEFIPSLPILPLTRFRALATGDVLINRHCAYRLDVPERNLSLSNAQIPRPEASRSSKVVVKGMEQHKQKAQERNDRPTRRGTTEERSD